MTNVNKLIVSIDNEKKKSVGRQYSEFLSSKQNNNTFGSLDITQQFNKARSFKNREVQKKLLLPDVSQQVGRPLNGESKQRQFRCYEKRKPSFSHTFAKQTQIIDQLSKRKITSGS